MEQGGGLYRDLLVVTQILSWLGSEISQNCHVETLFLSTFSNIGPTQQRNQAMYIFGSNNDNALLGLLPQFRIALVSIVNTGR